MLTSLDSRTISVFQILWLLLSPIFMTSLLSQPKSSIVIVSLPCYRKIMPPAAIIKEMNAPVSFISSPKKSKVRKTSK